MHHLAISFSTENFDILGEIFPMYKNLLRNCNGYAISDNLANTLIMERKVSFKYWLTARLFCLYSPELISLKIATVRDGLALKTHPGSVGRLSPSVIA